MEYGIKMLEKLLEVKKDSLEQLKELLGEDNKIVLSEETEIETLETSLKYLKEK